MDIKNIMQNRNHTFAVPADYFVLPYFSLYPYYNPNRVFWPDFRRNVLFAAKKSRIFSTRSRKRYRGFTQKP